MMKRFQTLLSTSGCGATPGDHVMSGVGTMALWYGVYFSNQVWAVQVDPIKPT